MSEEKIKEIEEEVIKDVKLSKDDKTLILPSDLNNATILGMSREVFETPFTKSYISNFVQGKKKNIHANNIFKFCVIFGCTPNDLFDYENWEYKSSQILMKNQKITNEDIKDFL